MSFDWLNIPGLESQSPSADNSHNDSDILPPPTVSFDFGTIPMNASGGGTNSKVLVEKRDTRMPFDDSVRTHSDTSLAMCRNPRAGSNPSHLNSRLEPVRSVSDNVGEPSDLDGYQESPEDLKVPLSLSKSQLSNEEARTYLRWYMYITTRTHGKLVKLTDIFQFLSNFHIPEQIKHRINFIFRSCKNALNIGQFFAVLRLLSSALLKGVLPERKMIADNAPIPRPKSILNTENGKEVYEEVDVEDGEDGSQPVDIDSFTSLMLTGKSTRKRVRRKVLNAHSSQNKRVRFSEHVTFQNPPEMDGKESATVQEMSSTDQTEPTPGPLDLSLPMEQLLLQMATRRGKNSALVSKLPNEQQETEEERQVLEDMKDSLSHFKQIQTVDSASLAGLPNHAPPIYLSQPDDGPAQSQQAVLQPLKPTATGSGNHLFRQQMLNNTMQTNPSGFSGAQPLQPLKPTATGSANYLVRSHHEPNMQIQPPSEPPRNISPVQNTDNITQPLKPTATGSANHFMKEQFSPSITRPNQLDAPSLVPSLPPRQRPDLFTSPQSTGQQHLGQTSNYNYGTQQNFGQIPNQQTSQTPMSHLEVQQLQQQHSAPQLHQQGTLFGTPMQNCIGIPQQQQQRMASPSMLAPTNAASSYFQSLLSNSPTPSPSSSAVNLPSGGHNTDHSSHQGTIGQQQPMYTGNYNNVPVVNAHQPDQQFFNHRQTQDTYRGNILGDLRSLQQQVDQLQNAYNRR